MNIYFSAPAKYGYSLHPMMKFILYQKTVSPFQIKEHIPSGGTNVSIYTHRLLFRVQEQLEIVTRRKLSQMNQKLFTFERLPLL